MEKMNFENLPVDDLIADTPELKESLNRADQLTQEFGEFQPDKDAIDQLITDMFPPQ